MRNSCVIFHNRAVVWPFVMRALPVISDPRVELDGRIERFVRVKAFDLQDCRYVGIFNLSLPRVTLLSTNEFAGVVTVLIGRPRRLPNNDNGPLQDEYECRNASAFRGRSRQLVPTVPSRDVKN